MNLSLITLVGKWLSILFVSILSFFNIGNYNKVEIKNVENNNLNKDISVYSQIIPHTKKVYYDASIDSKTTVIKTKGETGLIYNTNGKKTLIRSMTPEVVAKGLKVKEPIKNYSDKKEETVYVGKMSGYGPDCKGCSGRGNLACKTKTGKKFNLIKDGLYYEDSQFGNVRIIAGPKAFPCGTIIKVTKSEKIYYGIVLDYGGSMTNAWKNGKVWLDLAYQKEVDSGKDGNIGKNMRFEIKRWGW